MTPNPAERLSKFVMREYGPRLTPWQIRVPWHHIGSHAGEISGVVVPADGDSPGFRVMLVDFEGQPAGFTTNSPPPLELT
jgi:hypothetical protein